MTPLTPGFLENRAMPCPSDASFLRMIFLLPLMRGSMSPGPDVLFHLHAQHTALPFLGCAEPMGPNWLIRSHFRRVQVIEPIKR